METTAEVQCTLATMEDELSLIEENGEVTQEQKELVYKRIEELKHSNAALLAENDMFESFICRLDPQDLLSQAGGEGARAARSLKLGGGGVGWRGKSRSNISDHFQPLTLEQKLYVAQREVRETQQDREKLKVKSEKTKDNYKASMKEAELRLADIRKAKNDFERRLVKPTKDNTLEMKEPEKVLQYIEDKLKVTQLETFNVKNQALKLHEKKLLQQLQQKKEMGKAEYEEFFPEYDEPRPGKNLDELQINSLKVQRVLSSHKEKLQSVTLMSAELSNDIVKVRQMLAKIEEELQHAEKEHSAAEALTHKLRRQLGDYQAPDITEYMHVKDKYKKLKQSIHTWERKVGIAEMAFKTHTKVWNKQVGTSSGEHQIPIKLPQIAEHNQ
ncbi:cilia- and flagella-associated protein 263 isoform X1 [Oreochromis niloticus]|uniref:Cilia- and flagella-associated protein 263 n=2 Tax=Oreochromis niloticus TaxID=8128 RepID=I3JW38_ORENI|nr:coiled-coil domain-containing protein 113 isoform X1 [Oreochromis niloticus]